MESLTSKPKKTHLSNSRIAAAQLKQATMIEAALKKYDKRLRIRNVNDYCALVDIQRHIIESIESQEPSIRARLLDEYNKAKADYEAVVSIAKTQIEHKLIKLRHGKKPWERIEVLGRLKDFESAFEKLKRTSQGNILKPSASFDDLEDMAGLKVRVFPNSLLKPVRLRIEKLYPSAKCDHAPPDDGKMDEQDFYDRVERLKYFTKLDKNFGFDKTLEIQVVPFILDAFMDIEHDIQYKPKTGIPKIIPKLMQEHTYGLIDNLKNWPKEFSRHMRKYKK